MAQPGHHQVGAPCGWAAAPGPGVEGILQEASVPAAHQVWVYLVFIVLHMVWASGG